MHVTQLHPHSIYIICKEYLLIKAVVMIMHPVWSFDFKKSSWLTFFKFVFNWSIIVLQCCVSFCCTKTWISYKYTYMPSLLSLPLTLPSQPARSSQSTKLSSLFYIATSNCFPVLQMVVYMCQCYSPHFIPPFPTYPFSSLHLHRF